jgi:hypothetical protein
MPLEEAKKIACVDAPKNTWKYFDSWDDMFENCIIDNKKLKDILIDEETNYEWD